MIPPKQLTILLIVLTFFLIVNVRAAFIAPDWLRPWPLLASGILCSAICVVVSELRSR
ncbi:MAG: hypothetical protein JSS49_26715 [Planctomycetes bacterium]|nr:hypothetical protein [Planctomycetota bacterium]